MVEKAGGDLALPIPDAQLVECVEAPKISGSRTKARKRAVDLLFEAEQRDVDPLELLRARIVEPMVEAPVPQFTADIVEGVITHLDRIDELLETYSHGWTIDRMPTVDRALLRIATWELLYNDDVPDAVAVDEAVELAAMLSTDDSPSFINGLLGRIQDIKPTLFLDDEQV